MISGFIFNCTAFLMKNKNSCNVEDRVTYKLRLQASVNYFYNYFYVYEFSINVLFF